MATVAEIADRLIDCQDHARTLRPITAGDPAFDVARAYEVLDAITEKRKAQGWRPVGRKIGFTNRTIWSRYGVYQPMWAPVWAHTVHYAAEGRAAASLVGLVQPRIEPEVVFKLSSRLPATDDAIALLAAVEWLAAGFEIVQSHFPDWKFAAADCTAAFGLHGALIIGAPLAVTDVNRAKLAAALPAFELALMRNGVVVDRGVGRNVLDSPVNALAHLIRVLAAQPQFMPLAAGEVITTGTVTDAWPVERGETWRSDYGALPVAGIELELR